MEPTNATLCKHGLHGIIRRSIRRPSADDIATIARTYTGFVLDRIGKLGAAHPSLKPLAPGMRFCGPAVTALGPDLSVRRMAINVAERGDVLVVAAGGVTDFACFGDGTARRMMLKGIAGAVIDGATRDAGFLRELGFPTFVRATTPRNYHYPVSAEYGAVNVPVVCAGMAVSPGDLVMGDDDGVIVIPFELVPRLAEIGREIEEERRGRAAMTTFEPFPVESELLGRGYRVED